MLSIWTNLKFCCFGNELTVELLTCKKEVYTCSIHSWFSDGTNESGRSCFAAKYTFLSADMIAASLLLTAVSLAFSICLDCFSAATAFKWSERKDQIQSKRKRNII